jgi:adenylate kinase
LNVFVAGIHGVGKTHVAGRLPLSRGLLHTSASKLIREERALPEWSADKRVADVDENQVALASAVARYNDKGVRLLLDGHFILLDDKSQFIVLPVSVFRSLNLSSVVLIEAPAQVVAERLKARDGLDRELHWLNEFMHKEHEVAAAACQELGLPLYIITSPNDAEFERAVASGLSM